MKKFLGLFMIAIGMLAFTATAHTAKLEQKQKTELVEGFTTEINAVGVNDFQFAPVMTDVAIANDFNVIQFKNVLKPRKHFVIITDVGWQNSRLKFTSIPYKEKLLANSKNDLKFYKKLIRQDPFAFNQSFIYKRYC